MVETISTTYASKSAAKMRFHEAQAVQEHACCEHMAARQGHGMWKICTIADEDPDSGHPNLLKTTWMISWTSPDTPGRSKNCFHRQIPTQILEESWKETIILFKFPTWFQQKLKGSRMLQIATSTSNTSDLQQKMSHFGPSRASIC